MEADIRKILEKSVSEMGMVIDVIAYDKNRHQLNIVLDSDDIIDLDRIVKATNVISPILDKHDFIKEEYILDISSKEKGGNSNE